MTPDPDSPEAVARQRFQLLSLVRLGGVSLMILGFLIWRTNLLGVTHPAIGAVCVFIGAFGSLILPRILLRHWRIRP